MIEALCSQTEAYWFYWGWSLVYERMQKFFTSDSMREEGLDLADIDQSHHGPLKVLDVCAGTGTLSMQLLQRVEAKNLTLIDQSPQMLDQAKAKPELADASFVVADAHVLPFENDSFDRVVSSGGIYYFPIPSARCASSFEWPSPAASSWPWARCSRSRRSCASSPTSSTASRRRSST